jgi:MFS transporter, FHS family, L-fucose permease
MLVSSNATPAETGSGGRQLLFPGTFIPFVLVTALFFLWGIPNNLNDVLIRQFMKSFEITRFQAGLVQSAFYLGYFLLATPAALIMKKAGYKVGIITGLCLFASGTFLFWPAAIAARYSLFLLALFVIACGLSFLETASNSYITQLGDPATAARRLNISQAFNPLGAITGVLAGTIFIFSGVELKPAQVQALQAAHRYQSYLQHETMRVVAPYLILGTIALIWAALILFSKLPSRFKTEEPTAANQGRFLDLLQNKKFWFAVFAQFMYVGTQVGTWSYFIQYVQDCTHQPEKIAGYFLTGTLVAFALGRFISAAVMRYIAPGRLIGLYSIVNMVLVLVAILHPSWTGLWALFLTSFFMAPMFPTIFALGLSGLGPNTEIGSSSLVMAIVGGAVLTPFMGWISQSSQNIALAYLIPLIGYVTVAAFSFLTTKRETAQA